MCAMGCSFGRGSCDGFRSLEKTWSEESTSTLEVIAKYLIRESARDRYFYEMTSGPDVCCLSFISISLGFNVLCNEIEMLFDDEPESFSFPGCPGDD